MTYRLGPSRRRQRWSPPAGRTLVSAPRPPSPADSATAAPAPAAVESSVVKFGLESDLNLILTNVLNSAPNSVKLEEILFKWDVLS